MSRKAPAKRYLVEWSDPAYPRIREEGPGDPVGINLYQAKLEITSHAQSQISHWREILRNTRSLRAEDVGAEDRVYQGGTRGRSGEPTGLPPAPSEDPEAGTGQASDETAPS
jgi:hypothetical protein